MIVTALYVGINLLLMFILVALHYPFLKSKKEEGFRFNHRFDLVIACKNEQENVNALLQEVLNCKSNLLDQVIVVDDGSVTPLVVDKRIVLIRNENSIGKTKALAKAFQQVNNKWALIVDADLYQVSDVIKNFNQIVLNNKHAYIALLFFEIFSGKMEYLQFEDLALKWISQKTADRRTPILLSSAFLLVEVEEARRSLAQYEHPNGWDMDVIKKVPQKVQFPTNFQFAAETASKKNYFSYLRQRARWINNGLRANPVVLSITGVFTALLFLSDYFILASFVWQPLTVFTLLLAMYLIRTLSVYCVLIREVHQKRVTLRFLPFLVGQLFYGLNITIILIFLMLQRLRIVRR